MQLKFRRVIVNGNTVEARRGEAVYLIVLYFSNGMATVTSFSCPFQITYIQWHCLFYFMPCNVCSWWVPSCNLGIACYRVCHGQVIDKTFCAIGLMIREFNSYDTFMTDFPKINLMLSSYWSESCQVFETSFYAFVAFIPPCMIHVPYVSEVMNLTTPAMFVTLLNNIVLCTNVRWLEVPVVLESV